MANPIKTLYQTPFYRSWAGMKTRCYNSKRKDFIRYGGRGIKVCEKWQKFEGFYEDMFGGYREGLQIDRIDNNGDYEPANCRWATPQEQANNRRSNKVIQILGRRQTLEQWINEFGLRSSTVRQRFYCYGWPIEKALEVASHS